MHASYKRYARVAHAPSLSRSLVCVRTHTLTHTHTKRSQAAHTGAPIFVVSLSLFHLFLSPPASLCLHAALTLSRHAEACKDQVCHFPLPPVAGRQAQQRTERDAHAHAHRPRCTKTALCRLARAARRRGALRRDVAREPGRDLLLHHVRSVRGATDKRTVSLRRSPSSGTPRFCARRERQPPSTSRASGCVAQSRRRCQLLRPLQEAQRSRSIVSAGEGSRHQPAAAPRGTELAAVMISSPEQRPAAARALHTRRRRLGLLGFSRHSRTTRPDRRRKMAFVAVHAA